LKSSSLKRLRGVGMEKTRSNKSNMKEEGSRAENDCRQSGKLKRSRPKSKSRKALERTQSQRFNVGKVAGSEARRATFQPRNWIHTQRGNQEAARV